MESYGYLLIITVLSTCSSVPCDDYDVNAVNTCRTGLEMVISDMQNNQTPFQERLNKTCSAWFNTKMCIEKLMHQCVGNGELVREYNRTMAQLTVYATPCFDSDIKRRQQQIECYLPSLPRIHGCQDDFDQQYYKSVVEKQHKEACRLVDDIFGCYHDVTRHITSQCGSDGASEFLRDNVTPLLHEISPFVNSNCARTNITDRYFVRNSCQSIAAAASTVVAMLMFVLVCLSTDKNIF